MSKDEPEVNIQRKLVKLLRDKGWLVERILANSFQCGLPDLYCHHPQFGARWIEVKRPNDYSLTLRQRQKFPLWESFGVPIWILTAATAAQYSLLFASPNWRKFWRDSDQLPGIADIDAMLDEMNRDNECGTSANPPSAISPRTHSST
jgi:hypothetical protein